jgi:hypothetical protein
MAERQESVYSIPSTPGISRDGTRLDTATYTDGQWVRFNRGRPKKIGGYKEISKNHDSIIRGAFVGYKKGISYIYGFSKNKAYVSTTTSDVATSNATVSTLPGLLDKDSYSFQSDTIFDSTGSDVTKLLVHGSHNLADISDETELPVYETSMGTHPATFTKLQDGSGNDLMVSGGIVVLQPYVFAYGNNGQIRNSDANNPHSWTPAVSNEANEVNVAGTKIVKGLALRGGGSAPAGLFWSLDSLILCTRSGGEFRFDTVSTMSSVLSPAGIIEYDGVYYWIATDRFLVYNGTVKELPNPQSMNWFFDNLNYAQRSKVWAQKNTRYGEIWWHFPFGGATECTHAIIYNIRENVWYDTRQARSSGYSSQTLRFPINFGNQLNDNGKYSSYAQEYGMNAIEGGSELAIPSYFETSEFGYPSGGPTGESAQGVNNWTRISRIEPDFVQKGEMRVSVLSREFAHSPVSRGESHEFAPDTPLIDLRQQARHITLRFESNVFDGDYHMGRVILHTEPGDSRS